MESCRGLEERCQGWEWKGEERRKGMQNRHQTDQRIVYYRKQNLCDVRYNASEEELKKFKRMYVAKVKYEGNTHMVQEWFNMQGFFSIKVTPLGANLVLLEEVEEGIISALVSDAKEWIDDHFDGIRGWSPYELDKERAVWIRCHGIPAHAWNNEFFSMLAGKFGKFLGVDENTRKKNSMDMARILLRTNWYDVFNMVVHANINGDMFHIKVLEEWCGPMHWEGLTQAKDPNNSESDYGSDHESDDGEGPQLFAANEEEERFSDDDVGMEEGERQHALKTVTILKGVDVNTKEIINHDEEHREKQNATYVTHGEMENDFNLKNEAYSRNGRSKCW